MRTFILCNSRWLQQIRIFANRGCSTNFLMISGEKYFQFSRRLLRLKKKYIKVNMQYNPELVQAFQKCKEIQNSSVTFRVI